MQMEKALVVEGRQGLMALKDEDGNYHIVVDSPACEGSAILALEQEARRYGKKPFVIKRLATFL